MTNAIRHTDSGGDGYVELTVEIREQTVYVLVIDDGSETLPEIGYPDELSESGRGMAIIDEIATAWGYVRRERRGHPGGLLWFHISS